MYHTCRISVVGDSGVGKTSLCYTYSGSSFPGEYVPSVFELWYGVKIVGDCQVTVCLV